MKCRVCGAESGKYPLCRACNIKKEKGEIIKCDECGEWHHISEVCLTRSTVLENEKYLYEAKKALISKSEQAFYNAIKACIPNDFLVFPQVNLASFIDRTDGARFHNELFRNVDFIITNSEYKPQFIIEINDQTHLNNDRKERDEKVKKICEEAGVPILKLWTSYGVNTEYIKKRIEEIINKLPVTRIHHFSQMPRSTQPVTLNVSQSTTTKKNGCYIATCVYGSYDCSEVWVLRRYRDEILVSTWYGRLFIRIYYKISPKLVKWFGDSKRFKSFWRRKLDMKVSKLHDSGIESTPYKDRI